jgi:hypothetical protein
MMSLNRLRSYRDGLSGGEATDRLKAGAQRYHHADTTLVIAVRAVRWRTHSAPSFNVLTDWSEDPGAKAFAGFQPCRERSEAGQIKRT